MKIHFTIRTDRQFILAETQQPKQGCFYYLYLKSKNPIILKHFLQYRRCFYYLYNANKNKRIMDSGRFKKALGNYFIKREALLDNLF